ncbi:M14 family metallopeptidase [Microbulbifer pacificus]|uniref:M14 family metallopeptidase n=1 Tax=Microbulbifer pacificus TaxID=407164 RepID=A0AAU0MZB8_9GAMM|nr:M14 family metallopeptidase [Microbulbifer pacificus]WOX05859.1 M14 family metallopeptidase [Microbulbifer pacificus]
MTVTRSAQHNPSHCGKTAGKRLRAAVFLALNALALSTSATTTDKEAGLTAPLPPLLPWKGQSESLIVTQGEWVTPAEAANFSTTPDYETTRGFAKKLAAASKDIQVQDIGNAASGRAIQLITLSADGSDPRSNGKPTLLAQAGIHSGEIDGKDASFMLLRDYVTGNAELHALIQKVNLLVIPILNVDGHERAGLYSRMNQRGPSNAGWRTNGNNFNLNRDYAKLDTPELRAVMDVINDYQPELYLDIHVTDGEDYQYDITYGYNGEFASDSPATARWLAQQFQGDVDAALSTAGHIPGPLVFGINSGEFADGVSHWTASPRFSNGLGDLRHTPTVLIENHSLKPFRQRVLGTYVFIKAALNTLAEKGETLTAAIGSDQKRRPQTQVLAWRASETPDLNVYAEKPFKGMAYEKKMNPISGREEVVWLGKAKDYLNLPVYRDDVKAIEVRIPKAFYIPRHEDLVISRLKSHGIEISESGNNTAPLTQFTVQAHEFSKAPLEGHFRVEGQFTEKPIEAQLGNYVKVSTDQPLGQLATTLLDPRGPDSFFQWGFFNQIFQRTEYAEPYALVPLAEKVLAFDSKLKEEFEKRLQDKAFADDPAARMNFFYLRSPYYDQQYLKYPVLLEY